jgi:NAD(P)-dependent dehydrogenase (short-subunit alcohol dehydrogenase family)
MGRTEDQVGPVSGIWEDRAVAKTYAVTGAASGIGLAIALEAARRGARAVWAIDRNQAGLEQSREHYPPGSTVFLRTVDVTARDQVEALAAEWKTGDSPDVLVNVAGIRYLATFVDVDDNHWDETLAVNLTGSFLMMRAAARAMIAAGVPGVIVNIASTAGEIGVSDRAAYCASKSGVIGLTRAAALDLAANGIRVFAVSPGLHATGLSRLVDDEYVKRRIPLGRRGTTDELASVVLDLVKADYITGTSILVDGGMVAGDRRPVPPPP